MCQMFLLICLFVVKSDDPRLVSISGMMVGANNCRKESSLMQAINHLVASQKKSFSPKNSDGYYMDERVQYVFGTSEAQTSKMFIYSPEKQRNESSPWRRQYIVGMMACMVINGSEVGALFSDGGGGENIITTAGGGGGGDGDVVFVESGQKKVMMRWSDKRACPPWRMNSFETIVPENLPRPLFHRKSESIILSSSSSSTKISPLVKIAVNRLDSSCFSM